MLVVFALAIASLSACRGPDCSALPSGAERDGCLHTQASAAAKAGELEKAYATIRAIDGPVARAAAIDAVIATAPDKVDGNSVEALCTTLPQPFLDKCRETWNRPHLWNDPSARNR